MFMMRTDPLRGQVGGGWAPEEIETFLVPKKSYGTVDNMSSLWFWHKQDKSECEIYCSGSTPHPSTLFFTNGNKMRKLLFVCL
jgi:hypothetical protein